jgi:hypothetical protein
MSHVDDISGQFQLPQSPFRVQSGSGAPQLQLQPLFVP